MVSFVICILHKINYRTIDAAWMHGMQRHASEVSTGSSAHAGVDAIRNQPY